MMRSLSKKTRLTAVILDNNHSSAC